MIRTLLVALLLFSAAPASAAAQPVAMRTGSVVLPAGYTHVAFGGTDSSPGYFERTGGGFMVHYDIGGMAGIHMSELRRAECVWYVEHEVNGRRAYTGVVREGGGRRIITTIMGKPGEFGSVPANFTADVLDDRDVAEFMLIVGSYVPAPQR